MRHWFSLDSNLFKFLFSTRDGVIETGLLFEAACHRL